jgi:5-methylcytosine-specific restriction protein B
MGYKPSEGSYTLQEGVFYRFCQEAQKFPNDEFFFIIDEINRGNLSKIFGEVLMLIEDGYRGHVITLPYDQRPFSVPQNLYIIGMMNTADRSLAILDCALRRRFCFFDMLPAFDSDAFKKYQKRLDNDMFDRTIDLVLKLNKEIEKDGSLGEGFCIGHSYFCRGGKPEEWLFQVIKYELVPLLREYWFESPEKADEWEKRLRSVADEI